MANKRYQILINSSCGKFFGDVINEYPTVEDIGLVLKVFLERYKDEIEPDKDGCMYSIDVIDTTIFRRYDYGN